MQKIPVKNVTAWSYSRYADFKECPFKFKCKHIDRIKEPPNAAMERGSQIHKLAEDYIKGTIKRIPKELKTFEALFKGLRKDCQKALGGVEVEGQWGFDANWQPVGWSDWNRCWLRVKMDVVRKPPGLGKVWIDDWKTGKLRDFNIEAYKEQLSLYALAAFKRDDTLEAANVSLKYLDTGDMYPSDDELGYYTYYAKDVPVLEKDWKKKVNPMFKTKTYRPTPSNTCQWCHYRKDNKANGGGQCKY